MHESEQRLDTLSHQNKFNGLDEILIYRVCLLLHYAYLKKNGWIKKRKKRLDVLRCVMFPALFLALLTRHVLLLLNVSLLPLRLFSYVVYLHFVEI